MGATGRVGLILLVLLLGVPVVLSSGAALGAAVGFLWSQQAIEEIDPELRAVYEAAAAAGCESMPPSVLAALHLVRSDRSSDEFGWVLSGVNEAGEAGPYAIGTDLWQESWLRDGDGDGDTDVYDLIDTSHATAARLCVTTGSDPGWFDVTAALGVFGYESGGDGFDTVVEWIEAYTETIVGLPVIPIGVDGFTCPVQGQYSYVDDWHFPRSGGRVHKGIDIFAPRGTPVVAVSDGVYRGSSSSLGGLVVYTTEPDGTYYYYAHLDSLAGVVSGSAVAAGQPIGFVGNSGNAITTPTHVHFEVHPQGGEAARPWPWIAAGCPLG